MRTRPARSRPFRLSLTLLYESPGPDQLESPDNLVVTPFGDLLLCEDGNDPQYIRGLTKKGRIYDFARTQTRNDLRDYRSLGPRGGLSPETLNYFRLARCFQIGTPLDWVVA